MPAWAYTYMPYIHGVNAYTLSYSEHKETVEGLSDVVDFPSLQPDHDYVCLRDEYCVSRQFL